MAQRPTRLRSAPGDDGTIVTDNRIENIKAGPGGSGQYGNGINALVWSPDGKWLVSGNQDPSVHLWIPADDIELHMSGYEGKVRHLSFDRTSR